DPNESAKDAAAAAAKPGAAREEGKPWLTNKYDGDGRVESQALGYIPFTIAYGGDSATVTDANGTERIYALERRGGYPVVATSTVKDGEGHQWLTTFAQNDDTQVTRIPYPRKNGIAYEYDPENEPVTLGPIRDWREKDYTYENDLSRGN